MVRVREAERLLAAIARVDRKLSDSMGLYSHQAVATDMTVLAARGGAYANPARAIDKARAAEGQALEFMVEDLEDTAMAAERRAAIAAAEQAGIVCTWAGGFAGIGNAGHMLQAIRDLGVCRAAIANGTNPAYGRQRGAELCAELAPCGIDTTGYLPV